MSALSSLDIHRKDRVSDIHSFIRLWQARDSTLFGKGVQILSDETGYPLPMTVQILQGIFDRFANTALKERPNKSGFTRGFIFPANIPDPIMEDTIEALLEGAGCYVKLPSRFAKFGTFFYHCLQEASPGFGARVTFTADAKKFYRDMPALLSMKAYGHDTTLEEISKQLPKDVPFHRFGGAFSVGVVFKEALTRSRLPQVIQNAAHDVWIYDQEGCLSPQVFFVQVDTGLFARELKIALDERIARFGSVRRSSERNLLRRVFLHELEAESALGRAILEPGSLEAKRSCVYTVTGGIVRPGPGGQAAAVVSIETPDDLKRHLRSHHGKVQCIGVAGAEKRLSEIKQIFDRTSIRRICNLGQMQNPPLGWNRPDCF